MNGTYRYGVMKLGERRWAVIRWLDDAAGIRQTGWQPIPIGPFKTRREAVAEASALQAEFDARGWTR